MQQQLVNFMVNKISELSYIPLKDIDTNKPLINFGLNSLLFAEVGIAVEENFGIDFPFSEIEGNISVIQLCALLETALPKKAQEVIE